MSKALGLYLFYVELDNNDVYTALKQKVEETMTGTQWNGEDNEILPADFDEDTVSINQILKVHDIRVVFSLPMSSVIMCPSPPKTHPPKTCRKPVPCYQKKYQEFSPFKGTMPH